MAFPVPRCDSQRGTPPASTRSHLCCIITLLVARSYIPVPTVHRMWSVIRGVRGAAGIRAEVSQRGLFAGLHPEHDASPASLTRWLPIQPTSDPSLQGSFLPLSVAGATQRATSSMVRPSSVGRTREQYLHSYGRIRGNSLRSNFALPIPLCRTQHTRPLGPVRYNGATFVYSDACPANHVKPPNGAPTFSLHSPSVVAQEPCQSLTRNFSPP
jgi:hypothetical protein